MNYPTPRTTLEREALEASERAKPSSAPAHWAKRSCRNCDGRGVCGETVQQPKDGPRVRTAVLCPCAVRNFERWRDAFCAEYVRIHRTPSMSIPESATIVDKAE